MTHPPRDKRVLNFWLVLLGTVLAFLVLWANAGAGQAPLQQVKSIEIRVHGAPGHARAYEAMARDLIQFSTGDLYSPALVSQAVSRLTESGLFSHIHVPDPVPDKGAVQVAFALTPFGRVKDIRLSGAFPLFRKELLNVMTLYIGDAFSLERLEAQVPRIAKLYAREGFPSPHIAVRGEKDSKDGNYTVFIHVDKGDYLRVAVVDFSGNAHVSSSRLKLRLKTWRASVLFGHARRFIRKDMAGDVKNLVAFYRKKGFADVRVIPDVKVGGHEVRITYQIDEGLRYRVAFQGNDSIWTYTLKKDMVLAREGNRNNLGLRKSLRQVRRTYRDRGFSDVRLSHETRTAKDEAQVLVVVDQGRQYRVASVRIQGNPTIPEQEIRASMLTSEPGFWGGGTYVARHLDNDIKAIRALYQREGFARTRVKKRVALHPPGAEDPSDPLGVDIFLDITEGVRTRVDQVSFSGLSALSGQAAMDLISLKPGEPFRPYMVENDEKNLQQAVSELGYPRVRVRASQQMTPNHKGVTLDFHVDQGGFVRVGQIFYMGNFRTRSRVLDQELVLKTGDPLSLKKLLESRRNLLDVEALDSARIRAVGLERKTDEVDLVVEVAEQPPYYFDVGAGYDTGRHLYLNTGIGDKNFLGQNLDLNLEGEISQIGYKADLALTHPNFLAGPVAGRITATTRLSAEEVEEFNKDYGTRRLGISQKFFRSFYAKKLVANLGLAYEAREQYLTQDRELTGAEKAAYIPRHVMTLSPGLVFKTTDSYVRPTRGWLATLEADLSKGVDRSVDDFVKYRMDLRYYRALADPLVFALRGAYGAIQPFGGNDQVPEDQLFYLGGTATVRGFGENLVRRDSDGGSVGGREMILGSAELRWDLGLNFELAGFYDVGAVGRAQEPEGTDGLRSSAGLGLRYMTPVGPIGLMYGWKLDPRPGESPGSFHFSMGYTF